MAIKISQPFQRTGAFAVDEALLLTKEQMLNISDAMMPEKYFTLCLDDGNFYIYDKSITTPSTETGKFIALEGGSNNYNELLNRPKLENKVLEGNMSLSDFNLLNETEVEEMIDTKLEDYYDKTEVYTKDEVDELIDVIPKFKIEVVEELPTKDISDTTIYLLRNTDSEGNNFYDEYIYVKKHWELIGTTKVDLTNYVTFDDLDGTLLDYAEITYVDDELTALKDELIDEIDLKIDDPLVKEDGQILVWRDSEGNWVAEDLEIAEPTLTEELSATVAVGGIAAGKTFDKDTPLETLWKALIAPALNPKLTDPSASISYYNTTLLEVGATISAQSAVVNFDRGSISPAYGTSGKRSGEATKFTLKTSGATVDFPETEQDNGTFELEDLTRATRGNIVLTGTVAYAEGEQPKDSEGNNYSTPLAAGTKSAEKTYKFIYPFYWGVSDTDNVDLADLTKVLQEKGNKSYSYTTNDQHVVFVCDKTYNLKKIIDKNGFDVTDGFAVITQGELNIYVQNKTTDTNATYTFEF